MKNAHRTELEKELEKARKAHSNAENADIEEIRRQHEYVFFTDTALSLLIRMRCRHEQDQYRTLLISTQTCDLLELLHTKLNAMFWFNGIYGTDG